MISWAKVEQKYAANFKNLTFGQTAYSVRMALGALVIQPPTKLNRKPDQPAGADRPPLLRGKNESRNFAGPRRTTEKRRRSPGRNPAGGTRTGGGKQDGSRTT
jgi:hypothetical protein